MSKFSWIAGSAIVIVAAASAVGVAKAQAARESVEVEFQMYSGRRNPKLVVDDAATLAKVKAAFGKNRKVGANSLAKSRDYEMGYTGTVIKKTAATRDLPEKTLIHRRQLVATNGAGAAATEDFAEDPTGEIENTLIEHAASRGVIDANERAYLLKEASK